MTVEKFILEEFIKDIEIEGLFWRTSRPDTFIDLLMLESYKASNQGVNMSIAIKVVITSLKAIVNDRYGILDYKLDFKDIALLLLHEKDKILSVVNEILAKHKRYCNQLESNLFNNLDYFKVLNNLNINNYSVQVLENILNSFLEYIEANK